MAEHNKTGLKGELIAQDFLRKKGYEIFATNWQYGKVEIDIIAQFQNQLVVVEVKTRSSAYFGKPSEAVGLSKQQNIVKASNAFIEENSIDLECRFDVISVILQKDIHIEHQEDAFYPLL